MDRARFCDKEQGEYEYKKIKARTPGSWKYWRTRKLTESNRAARTEISLAGRAQPPSLSIARARTRHGIICVASRRESALSVRAHARAELETPVE